MKKDHFRRFVTPMGNEFNIVDDSDLDQIQDFMDEIINQLFVRASPDVGQLEHCAGELAHLLDVKFPKFTKYSKTIQTQVA